MRISLLLWLWLSLSFLLSALPLHAEVEPAIGQEVTLNDHTYILREPLGTGGFAQVYAATQGELATQTWTLKICVGSPIRGLRVLDPLSDRLLLVKQSCELLELLPRAARGREYLNLPQAYGLAQGQREGGGKWQHPVLLLPFKGPSLNEYQHEFNMRKNDPDNGIRLLHSLAVAGSMLRALELLAQSNLVHGDVKIDNMLLGHRPKAERGDFEHALQGLQLADWDLLRLQGQERQGGTAEFISPHSLLNYPQSAHREADLHALGLSLFALFTGKEIAPLWQSFEPGDFLPSVPDEIIDERIMRLIGSRNVYPHFQELLRTELDLAAAQLDPFSREDFFPILRDLILGATLLPAERQAWFRTHLDGAIHVDAEGGLEKLDVSRWQSIASLGLKTCELLLGGNGLFNAKRGWQTRPATTPPPTK